MAQKNVPCKSFELYKWPTLVNKISKQLPFFQISDAWFTNINRFTKRNRVYDGSFTKFYGFITMSTNLFKEVQETTKYLFYRT